MGAPKSHSNEPRLPARRILPALAVLAGMLTLEVGYGAGIGAALLFLGYEIGFRILPGWLLYRALATRPGGAIRQLALGWALGSSLEILAFIVTAALDIRAAFTLYPVLIAAPAIAVLLRRRRRGRPVSVEAPLPSRFAWPLAVVCLAAMGLLAIVYFPSTPLPGSGSISYFRDYPWHLGLAAEAKRHWPILDPNVSGEPFPYHYFVHIHMAAASQVTGIELPVVFFRLFNLPLILLSVLLFVTAGMSLARSAWIGLIAAVLALVVGDLQIQTSQDLVPHAPFLGVFVAFLATSPSFLFGLPMFLALLVTIGERLVATSSGSAGDWAIVALLIFGATNAKVAILPLIMGGLGVYGAWMLWANRRLSTAAVIAGAITAAAVGLTYLTQYAGHSSGLEVGPFRTFNQMPVVVIVKDYVSGAATFPLESALLAAGGVVIGTIGLLGGQLAGVVWIASSRSRARIRGEQVWLTGVLAASLLVLVLMIAPGTGNQLYFLFYGVVAGWLVAAEGFSLAWAARPPLAESRGRVLAVTAGFLVLLLVVMRAPLDLGLFSGADAVAKTYIFWYAGLAASLILLGLAARGFLTPSRWWAGVLVSAALLLVGAIGTVSNYVIPGLTKSPPSQSIAADALTPAKFAALTWIRDETSTEAVVAVNDSDPYNFVYAAFGERAVFLQGWAYTRESFDQGYDEALAGNFGDLFRDRFTLNQAAFAGDSTALAVLANEYGVRYLFVDPAAAMSVDSSRLAKLTTPVFEDDGVQVLEIRAEALPA